jgi:hypothetical protein
VIGSQLEVMGKGAGRGSVQVRLVHVLLSGDGDAKDRDVRSMERAGNSQARHDVDIFEWSWSRSCSVVSIATALWNLVAKSEIFRDKGEK